MVSLLTTAKADGILVKQAVFKRRMETADKAIVEAEKRGLMPTPYFVEAWCYWQRAKALQDMNIGKLKRS